MIPFKITIPAPAMEYTAEQMAIASCMSDRIVVRALAGTGKTETVALRARTQIESGITADEIMVTTFTRAAREQIKARLRKAGIRGVRVDTLHSVALSLLRNNGHEFGLYSGETFMRRALALRHHSSDPRTVAYVFEAMRRAQAGGFPVAPDSVFKPSQLRSVVVLYHRLKEESNAIDFDDLFFIAAPFLARSYVEVIVDEAQDLTPQQATFAMGLSSSRLVMVGDSNQAIFGWNGADGTDFDMTDSTELSLTRSFRSGPEILTVAERLIAESFSTQEEASEVRFTQRKTNHEEGVIASVRDGSRVVIGRTKAELNMWGHALEREGFVVDRTWLLQNERPQNPQVTLRTIHSAKGSEWDRVCIAGIGAEGFRGSDGTREEDRRLLYVASTRARRRLDVVYFDALPFEWSTLR